jgi:hypothetical protein
MTVPSDPERFIEALQPRRCPLCFLVRQYGFDHLKSLLDESVTDPHTRDRLYLSNGFCRRHAWQGVQQRQSVGMAAIYSGLWDKELEAFGRPKKFWRVFGNKICPICESESSCGRVYSNQFAQGWSQSEKLRTAFKEKGILCLPHLKTVLRQIPSPLLKDFQKIALRALENLKKDLNEFLSKQDYHQIQGKTGGDDNAWVDAVRMFCGDRD